MSQPIESILTVTNEEINNQLYNACFQWFKQWIVNDHWSHVLTTAALLIAVTILLLIVDFIVRKVLIAVFSKLLKRKESGWGTYLIQNKFLARLSLLALVVVVGEFLPLIFRGFPETLLFLGRLTSIVIAITVLQLINSVLKTGRDILKTRPAFIDKPLDSYLQVLQIFLIFIAGTVIFTIFTGKSPGAFLVSMGAMSAVLMLVFKDTILGFVASIQVSTNDTVRVGDWIEMPKFGADGDVVEINLNTVKVQNWDKTISTVPTYYLITEGVKNWRGMQESGGRRIKRAIHIKISSVRYLEDDEIKKLRKIDLLASYIDERQMEIDRYNKESGADPSMPINGRKMTNVGLYRHYIAQYTAHHPLIHKGYTMLVRQLDPTQHGLPIELYMYTSSTNWAVYENAMADIFDHLFASIHYFDLEIFEAPASSDFRKMSMGMLATTPPERKNS